MYAIVEIGGRQHRVSEGDRLRVTSVPKGKELLQKGGGEITIESVLAVGQGDGLRVGDPYVPNAAVVAQLEGEVLGPKVTVFKYARRKKERRKIGHRQRYMEIWVKNINPGDGGAKKTAGSEADPKDGDKAEKGT